MPFTLAHPAAAWPLGRTGLPLCGLVAGSMAPDVAVFAPVPGGYRLTHSAWGLVTVDLVVGLLGLAVWFLLARDALVDAAPAPVRDRLPARAALPRWGLVPFAVVVGAASHVVWDSFTHDDRTGEQHVAWLREEHLGVTGAHWAQYASSVLGLAVVAGWGLLHLRAQPLRPRPRTVRPAVGLLPVVLVGGLAVGTAAAAAAGGLREAAHAGTVTACAVAAVLVAAGSAAWQLAVRSR